MIQFLCSLLLEASREQQATSQTQPSADVITDPEVLVKTMERVNALFERMRSGCTTVARVIGDVMPHFLLDFFPPQDVVNKVVGELLSTQQSFPELVARILFKVNLHSH